MSQLLIEIDSPEDEAQLIQILPKYNSRLVGRIQPVEQDSAQTKAERLRAALQKLRASGVAEKYGDPIEWQREVRQDRSLIGRTE